MCIYPLIVLEMSILIWRTITCMTRKKVMQRVVLGLICIFIVGITYFANDPEYIYEEKGGERTSSSRIYGVTGNIYICIAA